VSASQPVFRYRAFLCYSHRDSVWADWLHHALESFPIPPRLVGIETGAGVIPPKLAPVFRDRDELPSAANLSAKVSDALAQSANLVVICSPHAAQSHWVDEEVRTFQALGRSDRIFCLIVDGEPGASRWAGREHDECIPSALTHRFDAAGHETDERLDPIAADARPGMDGKADARTKLVAGLLGVDLDDLRQRERRRRRWNLSTAIAAGFALLCLTTALAVNAVIARHAAERRQKQAEDLIGFMLGDLDDKLREVNRLDILESVGMRVEQYFASLPAADVTDESLAQRAKALLKIGSVHRDQGRVPEATSAFDLALAASEKLTHDMPDNAEYRSLHAESLTWLGMVDWSQRRLDAALARFVAAREILMAARARGAEDSDVLDRLAIVRSNAGRIFEARGQLDSARVEFAAVMELYGALSRREPEKLQWKAELGYAHRNLGRIALAEGALADSIREVVADRRIKTSIAVLDAANNERREDLAASNAALGDLLHLAGELDLAQAYLKQAVDESEALVAIDEAGTDWQLEAARYGWMWARVARSRGDVVEASRRATQSATRLDALLAKDPKNVEWQREQLKASLEATRCLLAQQHPDAARRAVHSVTALMTQLRAADDREGALLAAQADVVAGDVAAASGDSEGARAAWSSAMRAARTLANGSRDPATLDVLVTASLRNGEAQTVEPTVAALARTGYRQADFLASLGRAGVSYEPDAAIREQIESMLRTEAVARSD